MSEQPFPTGVWWTVLDSIGSDDGHVIQVQRYHEHYCLKVDKPDRSAVIIPIKSHHAEYLLAAIGALFRDFMALEGVTMTVETRPALKSDLYIDVDGVLFGLYNGAWQLRPDVVPFLRWCIGAFNCYWLTAWPKTRLDVLFSCLMVPDLRSIQEAKRTIGKDGKASAINYCHNFYWIEDAILDDERRCLERHQVLDRYIPVHHEGRDDLERVWTILREKVGGIAALGTKLRELRKHAGLTLNQLAEVTNLSISFLSDLERNAALPSLKTCKLLADLYQRTLADLLTGVNIDLSVVGDE